MAERKVSKVTQSQFGEALRNYVEMNPDLKVDSWDKHLPEDHWVYKQEGEWGGTNVWSRFYGNDRVFHLERLKPEGWNDYATKVMSPQWAVVEHIHQHFLGNGIEGMIADPTVLGNSFDHDSQMWSHRNSDAIYAQIIDRLKSADLLSNPSRKYRYTEAAKLSVPGVEPFDLPLEAKWFHYMYNGGSGLEKPSDHPKIAKYGDEIPALYLMGSTLTDEQKEEYADIIPHMAKPYTPHRVQAVPYTYGIHNRKTGDFTFRAVGEMTAILFGDTYHRPPEGFVIADKNYVIAADTMHRGYHLNNAERDGRIWERDGDYMAQKHPQLQLSV